MFDVIFVNKGYHDDYTKEIKVDLDYLDKMIPYTKYLIKEEMYGSNETIHYLNMNLLI